MIDVGDVVKLLIFAATVTLFTLIGFSIVIYFNFHILIVEKVQRWTLRGKIEGTVALVLFLLFGTWISIKMFKKNWSNVPVYDFSR